MLKACTDGDEPSACAPPELDRIELQVLRDALLDMSRAKGEIERLQRWLGKRRKNTQLDSASVHAREAVRMLEGLDRTDWPQ